MTGLEVPKLDRLVVAAGDQRLAVGREGQVEYIFPVTVLSSQAPSQLTRRRVPDVDQVFFTSACAGMAPRGEETSVRGEGHGALERSLRPFEGPWLPAGRGIPEEDLVLVVRGIADQDRHGLTVRGRHQVDDEAIVQRERLDRSRRLIAPPEDVPLEAAPVRLAGQWLVTTK